MGTMAKPDYTLIVERHTSFNRIEYLKCYIKKDGQLYGEPHYIRGRTVATMYEQANAWFNLMIGQYAETRWGVA